MRALPGSANTALRSLLTGAETPGRVVGVHPTCVYVETGPELVSLEAADGLGLPCAVRLGVDRDALPFAGVRQGAMAVVGAGRVLAGDVTVPVVRFTPARRLRPGRQNDRFEPGRVAVLARLLAAQPCAVPPDASVAELLGRGPGLTPAGDDVLVGLLVALHGSARRRRLVAEEVHWLLPGRTTTLSTVLLRHAVEGRALPAVLDVADGLGGHGSEEMFVAAVAALLAVGHSSGAALAHGLLRGARTVAATEEEAA